MPCASTMRSRIIPDLCAIAGPIGQGPLGQRLGTPPLTVDLVGTSDGKAVLPIAASLVADCLCKLSSFLNAECGKTMFSEPWAEIAPFVRCGATWTPACSWWLAEICA